MTWINLWMLECQGLGVGMKVFVAWFVLFSTEMLPLHLQSLKQQQDEEYHPCFLTGIDRNTRLRMFLP